MKAIGINMTLVIESATAYFSGTSTGPPKGWGNTPWLNAPDEHHRLGQPAGAGRVPGRGLSSLSRAAPACGTRRTTRTRSSTRSSSTYLAAPTFKDQNKFATSMQKILLHDTPTIFPYFYYYLAAGSKSVKGYAADPQGQVYLSKTSLGVRQ